MLRHALFRQYHIRDCFVRITRSNDFLKVSEASSRELRLLVPKTGTRPNLNSSWMLAESPMRQNKSIDSLSELASYQQKHCVVKPPMKCARRRRAQSMLVSSNSRKCYESKNNATLDDLHQEFHGKFNLPNRGLKPSNQRHLNDPQQQPLTDCQKILYELRAKLAGKLKV